MEDEKKTKKQMIQELNELRQSVAALQGLEDEIQQTRITQEKFNKAFLSNSIPVSITTLKEGRYIDVSDAFLGLMGRKRDEVIGHTSIEIGFITQEQRKSFFYELNKSGRIDNFEMEVTTEGGALRHGLFNAVMMTLGNEKYLLTVMTDITDRKQALHELEVHQIELRMQNEELQHAQVDVEALRAKYFDLYDLAPFGYVTVSEKGLILEGNLTAASLLDMTRHDLLKQPLSRFIIPEDAGIYYLLSKQLFKTGDPQKCELRMVRKDGTAFWAYLDATTTKNADGEPVSHVTINDITTRKQAEEALRESEKKYRTIFDGAPLGIFRSTPAGKFIEVNSALAKMLGYDSPEAVIKEISNIAKQIYVRSEERQPIVDKQLQLSGITQHYNHYRRADGTEFFANLYLKTIKDDAGQSLYLEGIVEDITERKQLEAEKAALEAQNRQLQKSESLGRMAAAIAHHFNNQLGVVIGNLEMAIDEQPKGATPCRSLTSAMDAAWRSADMSGLMLTYLGQTHEKVEPLDLSYTCSKSLPILKAAIPANMVMETNTSSPGPVINTNPDHMQQILMNLITNACDAVGKNSGTITLSVKTVSPIDIPTQNRFPADWESMGKTFACLEVTDTGCGIEDKDIENLFDPFYSTKFTGRGMGLAVVLGLANSHKGVITVDSKPGSGSTFRIFFPVSEEALVQPQTTENDKDVTISKPSSKKYEEGGTVLLVEDDAMLRDMAAGMLESFGFTVLKAKDGIDALEIFGKHQSEIKLVLTDLTMPRMNGWETLTALRKLQPDIPVILASGYDLAHVMEGDHPELPQAFLAKPYNLKALSDAIAQTLERLKT